MRFKARFRRTVRTYWWEKNPAAAGAVFTLFFTVTIILTTPQWRGRVEGPSGWSNLLQAASNIGTVISAVAVLLSLRFMADQVKESRNQVELTTRQMVETARQAEEGRHAAVHPELVLKQPRMDNGRPQDWAYIIYNPGVAPAVDVRLRYVEPNGLEAIEYRMPVLAVGGEHQVNLPPRGERFERCLLVLIWKNVLGRELSKQWEIEILTRGNRTWIEETGGKFELYS